MCGIVGFAGVGTEHDLRKMLDTLVHRGPDAEGVWKNTNSSVYLGHRRLSILDLEGGAQPMWTSDGSLGVIFNGEIYNHLELRRDLTHCGHRFRTDHSDTEVLLHGYSEWGGALPEKLNGMWAFVIYDKKKDQFFISRDRFGKKPLYYSLQQGTFAFASELTALLRHSNISSNLSPLGLKKYFAYGFIPAPFSLFQGIYKLPAGCNISVNIRELQYRIQQYWDFLIEPPETIQKEAENIWAEEIRTLLRAAVNRRLMSDVPLGVFLSGGIDSSSIAVFAAEASGYERMKSFCVGFEESSFDESAHSLKAAGWAGTDHHHEILSLKRASSILPDIIKRLDEPIGDSSLIPTFLLCREARKIVTVALGGDGGDELFAGYDPFHALRLAEFYSRIIPKPVHHAIRLLAARLPVSHRYFSVDFKINRTLRGLSYQKMLWNPVWLGPLEPSELEDLFDEPADIEEVYSEAINQWENCPQDNLVDKTLQFYTKLYLQDNILAKVDRASMMNSLEVRAPYLDIDLVDCVRRIPYQYKFRNGRTKYILKKALEPILPCEIINRRKKGFGVPISSWFKDGHLNFESGTSSFFTSHFPHTRLKQHRQGFIDDRLYLWNQWVLNGYLNHIGESRADNE